VRLFLCEKRSQAKDVAEALVNVPREQNGTYLCGTDVVTWASGHIIRQAQPEEMDPVYQDWKILPIIPTTWPMLPVASQQKQLDVVIANLKLATTIIHACDWDREGQLIGDELIAYAGLDPDAPNVYRLDFHLGNDRQAILLALQHLIPNHHRKNVRDAALARSRIDWLLGYNLSRVYTIKARKAGYDKAWPIGRVKTPTVDLVVKRDEAIEKFKKTIHYVGVVTLQHPAGSYDAIWKHDPTGPGTDAAGRIINRTVVDDFVTRTTNHVARVTAFQANPNVTEDPPLPLSLSELQRLANSQFKMTAKETLDAAQTLYDREKLISYPRSACRYIPEDKFPGAVMIVHAIARNVTYPEVDARERPHPPRSVNSISLWTWSSSLAGASVLGDLVRP
jgi:DNA topoisomerase-3